MWEYNYIRQGDPLEHNRLEKIGVDGWEMCGFSVKHSSGGYTEYFYYFKRPLIEEYVPATVNTLF